MANFLGVFGHVILDYIANLESLPEPNTSVQIIDRQRFFGGTGRPEYYAKIAAMAARLGKRVAFDPSQEIHYVYTPATFRSLLRRAEIFFGNQAEMKRALGFVNRKRPADLLEWADIVVMTRGDKGNTILSAEGKVDIPAISSRRVVDVTGAGDAYRAGFYAGLSRGLE